MCTPGFKFPNHIPVSLIMEDEKAVSDRRITLTSHRNNGSNKNCMCLEKLSLMLSNMGMNTHIVLLYYELILCINLNTTGGEHLESAVTYTHLRQQTEHWDMDCRGYKNAEIMPLVWLSRSTMDKTKSAELLREWMIRKVYGRLLRLWKVPHWLDWVGLAAGTAQTHCSASLCPFLLIAKHL